MVDAARPELPGLPGDVARCPGCRTYFRNPRPTQRAIVASYDRGLMYGEWREQAAARRRLWQSRLRVVRAHHPAGRLLDVGTGDGAFLGFAEAAGYRAVGVEPSRTGAMIASEAGHEVLVGSLEEVDLEAGSFDVVTAWHVLEHVPAPVAFLRRVGELLAPGGQLVVAVPNEARIFLPARLGWAMRRLSPLVPGEEVHLFHFEPGTLKRVLERAGFHATALGVDDVDLRQTRRNWSKTRLNGLASRLLGWHLSTAMYAVALRNGVDPPVLGC